MAGLVPAIHALLRSTKNVDARDKPGHDDLVNCTHRAHAGGCEASLSRTPAAISNERSRAAWS